MGWPERKAKIKVAGNRPKRGGVNSDFALWVKQEFSKLHPPSTQEQTDDFQAWVMNRIASQENGMDYGLPVRIFYANLLRMGITLRCVNGRLKVGGNMEIMTPVLKAEIVKRAEHLIDLLSPDIPEPLQPYFHRLILVDEVKEAVGIAEQMGISLRQIPVNGGWLVEIMNDRVRKEKTK